MCMHEASTPSVSMNLASVRSYHNMCAPDGGQILFGSFPDPGTLPAGCHILPTGGSAVCYALRVCHAACV